MICRKKSWGHRASNKNIRRSSYRKGHQLFILLSFDSVRALEIHDVARHVMYSVRTRDAQQQWARTSDGLSFNTNPRHTLRSRKNTKPEDTSHSEWILQFLWRTMIRETILDWSVWKKNAKSLCGFKNPIFLTKRPLVSPTLSLNAFPGKCFVQHKPILN